MAMNEPQRKHMLDALAKNIRFDGRKLNDYRNVTITRSVSETAEGSARVQIGETDVFAGVKLSIGVPYPDSPDEGSLMVGAELLPMSSPQFELGPPGIQAVELARVVDRGIRESKAIDVKKLCIKKGEKIWVVSIDVVTVNDAGNLFDAASLATLAALQDTRFPKYEDEELDYRTKSKKQLPLLKLPISVTVHKIGNVLLVDPTPEEEEITDARLTVAMTPSGELCALQKGGDQPLRVEEVKTMVELGLQTGAELRKFL